ncbi:MAG: AMP-binding protein [Candidatus Cloacimonetes bacterium]|nr:AMP-binding protein [Candidatus Cloacimonadota bacterium]
MQLHHNFIKVAKKNSKKIAVYDQATGKDITYERMLIASLILASKFSSYRGRYIGILIPTSAGSMLAILGTLMAGKIPVMINYSTGARENAIYAQDKCSSLTIISSKKLVEKIKMKPLEGMIFLEDIMKSITGFDKIKAALKAKMPTPIVRNFIYKGSDENTSVVLFTSGSEKDPKGVELSHKNIMHNVTNIPKAAVITPDFIFLANLPFFHVFGLTVNMWTPLLLGCSVVAYPNPLDYGVICGLVRKYKIDMMAGTPAFFYGYLKKSNSGDFASVKIAVSGADKLTPHIYDAFLQKHNMMIFDGYGTTETSPVISVNTPDFHKKGSIGKPIGGVQLKIVDTMTGNELARGEEGKIIVKGDMVMKGYLGDIEETSLRIRDGWYDTGDMGVWDEDGFLWHKGRLKRFVKIGGEMVSLVRIESIMEKFIPEDAVCCVVDVPNLKKGAEIVAALTTSEINTKKVRKLMAKELPSIALPKEFHVIEDIPMMPSGKVNFREVEKICRAKMENKNDLGT